MSETRANSTEIITVAVSPFHSARGPIVKSGPGPDEATISVGAAFVHGKRVSLFTSTAA